MPYTPELKELIKKVEATRPARVERKKRGEEFPMLSLKEREERLKKFHPDFVEGSRKPIRVGPNKGYAISPEIVAILEARSRVNPDTIDLTKVSYETDVLIIGGGGAGTAAALMAQENGSNVLIATKLRHGDANTMMAEGGIQAASKGDKDSPYYHYLDVLGGGHFNNDPELAYTLVTEAPKVYGVARKPRLHVHQVSGWPTEISPRRRDQPKTNALRRRHHRRGDHEDAEG